MSVRFVPSAAWIDTHPQTHGLVASQRAYSNAQVKARGSLTCYTSAARPDQKVSTCLEGPAANGLLYLPGLRCSCLDLTHCLIYYLFPVRKMPLHLTEFSVMRSERLIPCMSME